MPDKDKDIAPELLERLQKAFHTNLTSDKRAAELLAKIAKGGSYADAFEYSEQVGNALAEAFAALSSDDLPDGRMYWNIGDRVVRPLMTENYSLVVTQTAAVQQGLNKEAGLGIKAVKPEFNSDRVDGIVQRLADEPLFDDVAWILDEPVKVFSRSAVDDTVRANAEFQSGVGLDPVIRRTTAFKCCEWCNRLAGSHEYDEADRDVFKRHDNCRCLVELVTDKHHRSTIHSGKEGKRRYTNDGYDNYYLTTEARREKALGLHKAELERRAAARQMRIDTLGEKKQLAKAEESAKIEARKALHQSRKHEAKKYPINPVTGLRYIDHKIEIDDVQFGKKLGKHARDYGFDPALEADREKFKKLILDICENADERIYSSWRQQEYPVLFHIKDEDVVIEADNGKFITILKGGVSNERVKNARYREV